MPCSRSQVSSSSTPSATTVRPSEWASSTEQRTTAASWSSVAIRETKERSIFSSPTGRLRSRTSEEWPVPKSSRDIPTP